MNKFIAIFGKKSFIWIVLTPVLLYTGAFFYYPLFYNFTISFAKTNLLTKFEWTGFSNYIALFKSEVFKVSLLHNIEWLLFLVIGGVGTSIIIAELINLCSPVFKRIFTFLFFTPVVTSLVASSLVWKLLYFPKVGLFSKIFEFLGFGQQSFLFNPKVALICIIVFDIWKDTGLRVIILLAAMDQIPDTLLESADLDGASEFTKFLKIRLPLIYPQIFFLMVIYSINALRVFSQVFMMTQWPGGGPGHSTYVLNLLMYYSSFGRQNYGYGASVATVIFLLLFIFIFMQIRLNIRRSEQ